MADINDMTIEIIVKYSEGDGDGKTVSEERKRISLQLTEEQKQTIYEACSKVNHRNPHLSDWSSIESMFINGDELHRFLRNKDKEYKRV